MPVPIGGDIEINVVINSTYPIKSVKANFCKGEVCEVTFYDLEEREPGSKNYWVIREQLPYGPEDDVKFTIYVKDTLGNTFQKDMKVEIA